eukprot:CAMPEP_0113466326 /NCGR_PEP_ID=MMETSP0014_2-20120614/14212_1 /TAXON_ID=2857 /ORGANISM="Nitzschia sp." /LENGTH=149 /DNA_ID=CAMNT_0000358541 /DNA_START=323 /DNA_END=772 /DNA_ORIENTATION=+ /assembly_acc=CAM_ASM_000159
MPHLQDLIVAMDDKVRMWQNDMQQWKDASGHSVKELQVVLDNEVKVNSHFRTDLAEWLERRNDNHREEDDDRHVPSFIFATNLGETRDEVPLCCDEHRTKRELQQGGDKDSDDDSKCKNKPSRLDVANKTHRIGLVLTARELRRCDNSE